MSVTDEHVAFVRALVTGDDDAMDRLADGIDAEDEDWQLAFVALISVVFQGAVRYRFGGESARLDIVRFVARSRVRHGGDEAGFTPSTAEAMMGFPLGLNPEPADISEDESEAMTLALLKDLADDLTFLDFEKLLKLSREEVNRRLLHEGEEVRARFRDMEARLS